MRFRKMKRWCLVSVHGAMMVMFCAFDSPVDYGELLFTIPLFHHHSDSCMGMVTEWLEADGRQALSTTDEDVCPLCGGIHDTYTFHAECSCGKVWYTTGHACYNSVYGKNPGGGCPNYSVVNCDTHHDHTYEARVCGKEEDTWMGSLKIYSSDTNPCEEITLTATYEGTLDPPAMKWEEEPTPTEESEDSEDGENEEDDEDGEDVTEDPGNKSDTEKQGDPEETEDGESIEEIPETTEGEEEFEGTLTSSISVRKNGIYKLTATYYEDGRRYRVSKSVTVSNIIKKEPVIAKTEPVPPPAEPEEPAEEVIEEEPEEIVEEPFAEMTEEMTEGPLEEVSEEPVEEEPIPEGIVKGARKDKEVPGETEPENHKKSLAELFQSLPRGVQAVSLSVVFLLGLAGVGYGIFLLTSVAGVYWVDEKNRKHYFCGAIVRRWLGGYQIRIRKKELFRAKSDEILVLFPKIQAKVHQYEPLSVHFGEKLYSLHVERKLTFSLS